MSGFGVSVWFFQSGRPRPVDDLVEVRFGAAIIAWYIRSKLTAGMPQMTASTARRSMVRRARSSGESLRFASCAENKVKSTIRRMRAIASTPQGPPSDIFRLDRRQTGTELERFSRYQVCRDERRIGSVTTAAAADTELATLALPLISGVAPAPSSPDKCACGAALQNRTRASARSRASRSSGRRGLDISSRSSRASR